MRSSRVFASAAGVALAFDDFEGECVGALNEVEGETAWPGQRGVRHLGRCGHPRRDADRGWNRPWWNSEEPWSAWRARMAPVPFLA